MKALVAAGFLVLALPLLAQSDPETGGAGGSGSAQTGERGSDAVRPDAGGTGSQAPVVGRIRVKGNDSFADRELKGLMTLRQPGLLRRVRFDERQLAQDVQLITRFYQQNGYLDVRIDSETFRSDDRVAVTLRIQEGPLTTVGPIGVLGNTFFDDQRLLAAVSLSAGQGLARAGIRESTRAIASVYWDAGFLDARVDPQVSIDTRAHRASVDFLITEGVRVLAGKIRIQGLQSTHERVVLRELVFEQGDVLSQADMLESERRLYNTGLFHTVYIHAQEPEDSQIAVRDVLVELEERDSIEINLSLGYETDEQASVGLDITENNLGGTGTHLGATGRLSFISRSGEIFFVHPRTGGTPVRSELRLRAESLSQPAYDVRRVSGEAQLGIDLSDRLLMSADYSYEWTRLTNVSEGADPGFDAGAVQRTGVEAVLDARDDLLDPQRGAYLNGRNELAFIGPLSGILYRVDAGARGYLPLIEDVTVLASAAEVAWVTPLSGTDTVPITERLFAGGAQSVRGFGYQELGPEGPGGDPSGGTLRLVLNVVELRQSIFPILQIALFADAGQVWAEAEQFDPADLRWGMGAGLRLVTPLAVFRLDMAFNVARRAGERPWYVYFNVGQAF